MDFLPKNHQDWACEELLDISHELDCHSCYLPCWPALDTATRCSMLASNATSRQQAHSRMGRPTTGCAGRWHVVKDKDPSTCFVFVTSRGSGQAACGLPLDARSLQPVSGWDEGVQRALLVGCCLQNSSHAVLSFSWHERFLVWAAVMINNTRLSHRASIHNQPT